LVLETGMGLLLLGSVPGIFNFAATVVLLQISGILLIKGSRFLKQISVALASLVGAVAVEGFALALFPQGALLGIGVGLAGGAILGYYLRPVGVGLALSYLALTVTGQLVAFAYLQYVAAIVIFAYGILLTDIAPAFIASLLACSILLLFGVGFGLAPVALVVLVSGVGIARIMASVLPGRLALRSQKSVIQN
jgi:hypothetical protein